MSMTAFCSNCQRVFGWENKPTFRWVPCVCGQTVPSIESVHGFRPSDGRDGYGSHHERAADGYATKDQVAAGIAESTAQLKRDLDNAETSNVALRVELEVRQQRLDESAATIKQLAGGTAAMHVKHIRAVAELRVEIGELKARIADLSK
tara:strand:- start:41466 stop:41912 length:447 start_codon:yes stop_codon:yes gene_type:complete